LRASYQLLNTTIAGEERGGDGLGNLSFCNDKEDVEEGGEDEGGVVSRRQNAGAAPSGWSAEAAGGAAGGQALNMLCEMFKTQQDMQKELCGLIGPNSKRKKSEDEEEVAKSQPVLLEIENHHLKDDAHDIIDWKARLVRPYNGKSQDEYWTKRPRKAEPVLEMLNIAHLTKNMVNPSVIGKAHDRGQQTTGKQWLSSNYLVEQRAVKVRLDNPQMAASCHWNYEPAKGCHDVVDAIWNYIMVMHLVGAKNITMNDHRHLAFQVRPDDYSGLVLLRNLHFCRFFAHPSISPKEQREMLLETFDQVRSGVGIGSNRAIAWRIIGFCADAESKRAEGEVQEPAAGRRRGPQHRQGNAAAER
jgi:hypothetical protein